MKLYTLIVGIFLLFFQLHKKRPIQRRPGMELQNPPNGKKLNS